MLDSILLKDVSRVLALLVDECDRARLHAPHVPHMGPVDEARAVARRFARTLKSLRCPEHGRDHALVHFCPACRAGGSSAAKRRAARRNGKLGGRPVGSKTRAARVKRNDRASDAQRRGVSA